MYVCMYVPLSLSLYIYIYIYAYSKPKLRHRLLARASRRVRSALPSSAGRDGLGRPAVLRAAEQGGLYSWDRCGMLIVHRVV